jgi:8-oxo-dGTP pyrophosphatase MutT (NUDIX family)
MSKDVVYRAGFIPYRLTESGDDYEFYLMKPSNSLYGGDQFQIAKGKIDDGETAAVAALREASEELGLIASSVSGVKKLGVFLGRMTVYIGRVSRECEFKEPHFETGETTWMTVDEFSAHGRELQGHIIRAAHTFIQLEELFRPSTIEPVDNGATSS